MDSVNKTLYIPLYGKAFVSRLGILLHDPKAEQIWQKAAFPLKGKAKSKWLAYYMAMRAGVFDRWLQARMDAEPEAVVIHLGCGLDSRAERLGTQGHLWYDVDFPEVIRERSRYFQESETYRMIGSDILNPHWLQQVPSGVPAIFVVEGVSMYLPPEALKAAMSQWAQHFSHVSLLMDNYTQFAAKVSKYKNPINTVGVTKVYGFDDPHVLEDSPGFRFLCRHEITPESLIRQLSPREQRIFRLLYAGKTANNLYQLHEYRSPAK